MLSSEGRGEKKREKLVGFIWKKKEKTPTPPPMTVEGMTGGAWSVQHAGLKDSVRGRWGGRRGVRRVVVC